MEHLTSPGDVCFTQSEAQKLTARINKLGVVEVSDIQGVWIHYTNLRHLDRDAIKVRIAEGCDMQR
jgi:hypothetical protein